MDIDYDLVYEALHTTLDDLEAFLIAISVFLRQQL
jgi:hypothetical protein